MLRSLSKRFIYQRVTFQRIPYVTFTNLSTTNNSTEKNPFESLNLAPQLISTITSLNWKYPTTVQYQTIPLTLEGKNVVASSWTGQGKTFCYLFPILTKLIEAKGKDIEVENENIIKDVLPKAIVLTPSTELAKQVYNNFKTFTSNNEVKVGLINSNLTIENQLENLSDLNVEILVTTPGRLLQLLKFTRKCDSESSNINLPKLRTDKLEFLVIDEVDKLLSLGHLPEVLDSWKLFLDTFNHNKKMIENKEKVKKIQVLMYSATLVKEIHGLVLKLAPHHKLIDLNKNLSVPKTIKQIVYKVNNKRKLSLLLYLLRRKGNVSLKDQKILVFTRTIQRCERLVESLKESKILAEPFHADLTLNQRTSILNKFENNKVKILVATDLVTRGIDFKEINYVINYDLPLQVNDYVHRVGRTGRLHSLGTSISLVSKDVEVISRPNSTDSYLNELEILDNLVEVLNGSGQDKNCSKLEIRKIPGPFLDIDQHFKVKNTVKDSKFKSLLEYVDIDNNNNRNKILAKDEHSNDSKVNYKDLINKFEQKNAKKKGVVLTKRDKNSNFYKR